MQWFKKGANEQISEHFNSSEFDCECTGWCADTLIDVNFVKDKLEKIRSHFGEPIHINSGYRCERFNASIGGASSSYHVKGRAYDIWWPGMDVREVARYCESIGVKGIGCYTDDNFVHVDSREEKYFWYDQTVIETDTFGGCNPIDNPSCLDVDFDTREGLVKYFQSCINYTDPAYALAVDGIWGEHTAQASRDFLIGLGYDSPGMTKVVQRFLGISIDGISGPETDNAIREFQANHNLTVDGIVGEFTWRKFCGVD